MNTLLILAYEFVPYHRPGSTIGAQRPFQFAKHLPKFGWNCIVICCEYQTRYTIKPKTDWKKEIELLVETQCKNNSENPTVVIPLPSLSYASVSDKLWHGTVIMDKIRGTFSAQPGLLKGILRPLSTFFKLFTGDHSQSWQPVAQYASELIMSKIKVDMILAEHSPDASVFVACRLSDKTGIPWVIDFRDPMLRDMKETARFFYKYFTIPRFRNLSGTINVNDYWVELDSQIFKKKAIKILNGFDPDEFTEVASESTQGPLRVGYFGSIQAGQDIKVFLSALKNISGPDYQIHFIYRGNRFKDIAQLFQDYNGNNVIIDSRDSVSREESICLMASCDVLLLLSLKNEGDIYLRQGVVPGKTFEYFALKKPILLSTGDGGLLDELISQSGTGIIGKDCNSIESLLRTACKQKSSGEKIWDISYNEQDLRLYTREKQAGLLADFMESLLR